MKMSPLVSTWFIHAPKFHANLEIIAERQEKGHRWVLQIRTFGPRQSGKYCAVAKNRNGTTSRVWHLHLRPSEDPKKLEDDAQNNSEESEQVLLPQQEEDQEEEGEIVQKEVRCFFG